MPSRSRLEPPLQRVDTEYAYLTASSNLAFAACQGRGALRSQYGETAGALVATIFTGPGSPSAPESRTRFRSRLATSQSAEVKPPELLAPGSNSLLLDGLESVGAGDGCDIDISSYALNWTSGPSHDSRGHVNQEGRQVNGILQR
jgi:hypothetical protein